MADFPNIVLTNPKASPSITIAKIKTTIALTDKDENFGIKFIKKHSSSYLMKLFQIVDKFFKKIYLTKERWRHISQEHPDIKNIEELEETLKNPVAVTVSDHDPDVKWFYRFIKKERLYILVSVKYLNDEGFIITAHYTKKIK